MKVLLTGFLTLLLVSIALAQREELKDTARFKDALSKAKQDTTRVLLMAELAEAYRSALPDSALFYGQQALSLARLIKFPKGEVVGLLSISVVQRELGNHSTALDAGLRALLIARTNNALHEIPICLVRIGNVYLFSKNYREALKYYLWADEALKLAPDNFFQEVIWLFMSGSYVELNILDSALQFEQLAYPGIARFDILSPLYYRTLGRIQAKSGNSQLALESYRQGIQHALAKGDLRTASTIFISASTIYKKLGLIDSAISYARQGLNYGQNLAFKNQIMDAGALLADLYEQRDINQSLYYYKMASAAKDSMYSAGKMHAMQSVILNEQERQRESEATKTAYQNKVKQLALLGGLVVFLIIASILYRNIVYKQKANTLLKRQKQEIEDTLTELRSTQAQLIQSEKMASLGELTAGIAHEIQNPLNFVNNFSEVNGELIEELKVERAKGNGERDELLEDKLLTDLAQNLEKINQHGKRADAIVKSMMQHSNASTGQKELVNMNSLAEEYLRLSFHGMRARDKDFHCEIRHDFDQGIEKIRIVPPDMGRVFLNLFNNAFYSLNEKKKKLDGEYEPELTVSTKRMTNKVEIRIRDNGLGIPQKNIDKIFQPFYTTKPTGQGTGLGLSLSYDIITKEHGGTMQVESMENEFAEFVIILPMQ